MTTHATGLKCATGARRFCPRCQALRKTNVLDTCLDPHNRRRRRLVCRECGERWTTYELRRDELGMWASMPQRVFDAALVQIREACASLDIHKDAIVAAARAVRETVCPAGAPLPPKNALLEAARAATEEVLRGLHPVAHVRYALAMRCRSAADCLGVLAEHMVTPQQNGSESPRFR